MGGSTALLPIPEKSECGVGTNMGRALTYLLEINGKEKKMKGCIRPISRQMRCPKCGKKFQHFPKFGYVCFECQTKPDRFYIDIFWQGSRKSVCSDKQGIALDSYDRAFNLLSTIQGEIDNHTFDPSRYVASDLKHFWASTLLSKFEEEKKPSLAPSYVKDFERYILAAKEFFDNKDVREIRKKDLVEFKKFVTDGYTAKGRSLHITRKGKTVKNYLDVFRTFLIYLKNDLEILQVVPSFPEIEVEEYEWKWIDSDVQLSLLSHTPENDRPLIGFLMLHGCRPGEARALQCKNVDTNEMCIRISSTFSGKVLRNKRKGKKSRVVVIPIHPEFYEYFAEKVSNNLPDAFMFVNPRTGTPYSESAIQRLWDSVRVKAGVSKDLRLYDASRHSFASQLINSDIPLLSVSRLLGHSSTKMTEKYAHNKIDKLRADIAKLSLQVKKADVVHINRPIPLKKVL